MFLKVTLTLIAIFVQVALWSQPPYFYFHKIPTHQHDGKNVKEIVEDKKGYLWLIAESTVQRFDGNEFESIAEVYPIPDTIGLYNVRKIIFDSDNSIWMLKGKNKLIHIDLDGSFSYLRDEIDLSNIVDFHLNGRELVVCANDEIRTYETGKDTINLKLKIPLDGKYLSGLFLKEQSFFSTTAGVYQLTTTGAPSNLGKYSGNLYKNDADEIFLLSSKNALLQYDIKESNFGRSKRQPFSKFKGKLNLCWDQQGGIWSTHFGKGLFYSPEGNQLLKVDAQNANTNSLTFPRKPYCDAYGNIWVPSNSLLKHVSNRISKPLKWDSPEEGNINFVYDDEHLLCTGIYNNGIIVFDKKKNSTQHFTKENSSIFSNLVSTVTRLNGGQLGINFFGGFQLFDGENKFSNPIKINGTTRCLLEMDNQLWVGAFNAIYQVDPKSLKTTRISLKSSTEKIAHIVNNLFQKDEHSFYIVSHQGGLFTYDIREEKLEKLKNTPQLKQLLNDGITIKFAQISTDKKKIYLGTNNGCYVQSMTSPSLKKLSTPSLSTYGLALHRDSLWVINSNRIGIYNLTEDTFENISLENGQMNESFAMRAFFKNNRGDLFIGGNAGIDFYENKIPFESIPPRISIDQITLDKKQGIRHVASNDKIVIPSGTNLIDFKIDGIHFSHLKETSIYFQNDDSDWQEIKNHNMMTLIAPKAGDKHFKFKALNGNKIESEIFNLYLEVREKWYKTTWFKILSIFSILLLIGGLLFRREKQKQKKSALKAQLDNEILQLRLQAINNQMNPHFIFNSMSSIQQLISENNTENAMAYLSKFSRLLRHVINYTSKKYVPLSEELSFIENYLNLEEMRFNQLFDYTIDTSEMEHMDYMIPTFIIQPQVENAIKHGFKNIDYKGKILITCAQTSEEVIVTIEDNGVGRAASKTKKEVFQNTGKGILLTKKKIEHLNRNAHKATYTIENNIGGGTKVKFVFTEK